MGGAFVGELIDTFAEDAREQIAAIGRALVEADVDVFRRAAHSLKSTSESLGATGLAALARELEAVARTGRLEGTADRVDRSSQRIRGRRARPRGDPAWPHRVAPRAATSWWSTTTG